MTVPRWVVFAAVVALSACERQRGDVTRVASVPEALPLPLARADSLYRMGSFAEAQGIWSEALTEAWERGDSSQAARILTSLGLVARQLGDYPQSRRAGLEALDLKLRLGMKKELFRSYNALGLLAWTEGRLEEAAEMFERASGAAEAADDVLGVAKAASNMAQVYNDRGEPYRAREGFSFLADVSRTEADTVSLARALINIAMLDIRLGDPLSAVVGLEEARRLARASGDAEAEENALGQLATAFAAMGEPQRSIATLDTALSLAEAHGLRRQVAEDWKLYGDLFAEAGDHRRALDHYARAQAVNDDLGLLEESGNVSVNEARSYLVLGHSDTALSRARSALVLHRTGGYRQAELGDHLLLAEILASRADGAGAAQSLAEANRLSRELTTPISRARVAVGAARVWDRLDEPEKTLSALDAASDVLQRLSEAERWEPDALKARAHAQLGHLMAAESAGRLAVASIERVRAGYASGDLRTSFLSARAEAYADLVLVLLRQDRVEDAFEVADAARGRALLDHLAAARRDIERQPRSAAEMLELDRLLRRIDALASQLQSLESVPPGERGISHEESARFFELQLAEARRAYERRLATVAATPELALLGTFSSGAATIRAALRPGEAIVEYFTSPSELHIFVVRSDRIAHAGLAISREALADRVRLARDLVSDPDGGLTAEAVLRALFQDLLAPAIRTGALNGVHRLIVVPHGPLTHVPFAALLDEKGKPTVSSFSVAVLPAAGALPALRSKAPRHQGRTRSGGLALAPLPDALPATREEALGVQRVLGGDVVSGSDASERVARRGLESVRVVHFATHGSMNPVNPMFSRLDLAPGAGGDSGDDGRLEVHELLGLRIASDLVFLSGCETGRGGSWSTAYERSEGYATLAQAFLYAGAGNVVATLWRVTDSGAADLARRFYEALEGDPVSALAAAQRQMLADGRYSAPYYWATYQVLGAGAFEE